MELETLPPLRVKGPMPVCRDGALAITLRDQRNITGGCAAARGNADGEVERLPVHQRGESGRWGG